jgi:hypothetical protein
MTDCEKYKLLTRSVDESISTNTPSTSLDCRYFPYKGGSKQHKITFQKNGSNNTHGFSMVDLMRREVGAYLAFSS